MTVNPSIRSEIEGGECIICSEGEKSKYIYAHKNRQSFEETERVSLVQLALVFFVEEQ